MTLVQNISEIFDRVLTSVCKYFHSHFNDKSGGAGEVIKIQLTSFVHLSSDTQISLTPLCSGVFNFRVSSVCFDNTSISPITANFIAFRDPRCEDELTLNS